MIQGSPEWIAARVGKVTASRVADVFAKPRKGNAVSAVRESYLADLLAERLTGRPTEKLFVGNDDLMARGRDLERWARDAYSRRVGYPVIQVGFVDHPIIPMSGASPDGLDGRPGDGGIVEIKCPKPENHAETVRLKRIPPRYIPQIKWNLACTGRDWCNFISYDPAARDEDQLFIATIEPNPSELRAMEMGVIAFLLELEARVAEHQGEAA